MPCVLECAVERLSPASSATWAADIALILAPIVRQCLSLCSDAEIAAAVTYIHNGWGNRAGAVRERQVTRLPQIALPKHSLLQLKLDFVSLRRRKSLKPQLLLSVVLGLVGEPLLQGWVTPRKYQIERHKSFP